MCRSLEGRLTVAFTSDKVKNIDPLKSIDCKTNKFYFVELNVTWVLRYSSGYGRHCIKNVPTYRWLMRRWLYINNLYRCHTMLHLWTFSNRNVFVAGSTREGGLVWRGCSASCDAEDGAAAGALGDGNANPADKVTTPYTVQCYHSLKTIIIGTNCTSFVAMYNNE